MIVCPHCRHEMERTGDRMVCGGCHAEYAGMNQQPDFRLKSPKDVNVSIRLADRLLPEAGFDFKPLPFNPSPQVDYSNVEVPWHITKEMLSHFPKAPFEGAVALDIGCGKSIHRGICEHAGFEYVGLDYYEDLAHMLGDGHALPFKDNSFDFLLSIAVLEHIQFPFVMTDEAFRVLKPGGKFIGTVAFLEPFHDNSYYHHSHLGTYNSLKHAGFDIEIVAPSREWSVLRAQAPWLFRKMPPLVSRMMVAPLQLAHRAWWKFGGMFEKKASEANRVLFMTGSFTFIAYKR